MLFTHEGRLTPELERPSDRGRLEQVLGNWEESEEGRGLDGPSTVVRSEQSHFMPHCEKHFGADFSPLSSCRSPQAALNFSDRSDRVTRD